MESTISNDALIFYGIAALFIGFIVIGIAKNNSDNRYSKPLPKRPEPLAGQQAMQMPEIQGNFDANALNTAKAMAGELERYPDPTSRTLALAEMIHRQKQYEIRQSERALQEQRKEQDALDRVLALADRMSGRGSALPDPRAAYRPEYPDQRGSAFPDPRARRINNWHQDRQIADQAYWDGGYYK